jgi:hypothetical protein
MSLSTLTPEEIIELIPGSHEDYQKLPELKKMCKHLNREYWRINDLGDELNDLGDYWDHDMFVQLRSGMRGWIRDFYCLIYALHVDQTSEAYQQDGMPEWLEEQLERAYNLDIELQQKVANNIDSERDYFREMVFRWDFLSDPVFELLSEIVKQLA